MWTGAYLRNIRSPTILSVFDIWALKLFWWECKWHEGFIHTHTHTLVRGFCSQSWVTQKWFLELFISKSDNRAKLSNRGNIDNKLESLTYSPCWIVSGTSEHSLHKFFKNVLHILHIEILFQHTMKAKWNLAGNLLQPSFTVVSHHGQNIKLVLWLQTAKCT